MLIWSMGLLAGCRTCGGTADPAADPVETSAQKLLGDIAGDVAISATGEFIATSQADVIVRLGGDRERRVRVRGEPCFTDPEPLGWRAKTVAIAPDGGRAVLFGIHAKDRFHAVAVSCLVDFATGKVEPLSQVYPSSLEFTNAFFDDLRIAFGASGRLYTWRPRGVLSVVEPDAPAVSRKVTDLPMYHCDVVERGGNLRVVCVEQVGERNAYAIETSDYDPAARFVRTARRTLEIADKTAMIFPGPTLAPSGDQLAYARAVHTGSRWGSVRSIVGAIDVSGARPDFHTMAELSGQAWFTAVGFAPGGDILVGHGGSGKGAARLSRVTRGQIARTWRLPAPARAMAPIGDSNDAWLVTHDAVYRLHP